MTKERREATKNWHSFMYLWMVAEDEWRAMPEQTGIIFRSKVAAADRYMANAIAFASI